MLSFGTLSVSSATLVERQYTPATYFGVAPVCFTQYFSTRPGQATRLTNGEAEETYDNSDVTGPARVFAGLSLDNDTGNNPRSKGR